MARNCNGTTTYWTSGSNVFNPSTTAFTAAGWVKFSAMGVAQGLLSQLDGAGTGQVWLRLNATNLLSTSIGGSATTGTTVLTGRTGEWFHTAVTVAAGPNFPLILYLNGSAEANAPAPPGSATGAMRFGANKTGGILLSGHIAEWAIWNAVLTAKEILALAHREHPVRVRPLSLKAYWDFLGRASPEPEMGRATGNSLTLTGGSSVQPHPPVRPMWRGTALPFVSVAAAAPPAGEQLGTRRIGRVPYGVEGVRIY